MLAARLLAVGGLLSCPPSGLLLGVGEVLALLTRRVRLLLVGQLLDLLGRGLHLRGVLLLHRRHHGVEVLELALRPLLRDVRLVLQDVLHPLLELLVLGGRRDPLELGQGVLLLLDRRRRVEAGDGRRRVDLVPGEHLAEPRDLGDGRLGELLQPVDHDAALADGERVLGAGPPGRQDRDDRGLDVGRRCCVGGSGGCLGHDAITSFFGRSNFRLFNCIP